MTRRRDLEDEISLRDASLRDARREFDAGDLTAEELADIEARDLAALQRARLELGELSEEPVATSPDATPRRRRRGLLYLSLVSFFVAVVIVLVAAVSARQNGQSATGSVSVNSAQEAANWPSLAESAVASGSLVTALTDYQHALAADPRNYVALTQVGWLTFSAGATAHKSADVATGLSYLKEAISVEPTLPSAYLYYAIAAQSTPGNTALAIRTFRKFLSLSPTAGEMASAKPWLVAAGLTK